MIAPSDIYPCADGKFIAVSPTGQQFWEEFCVAIGRPDIAEDPALRSSGEAHEERPGSDRGAERGIPLTLVIRMKTTLVRPNGFRRPPSTALQKAVAEPRELLRKMVEPLENPRGAGVLNFLGNPIKYEAGKPLSYPPPRGDPTRDPRAGLRLRRSGHRPAGCGKNRLSRSKEVTRPSEIKPREGEQPAALYKDWTVGAEFPPLPFTITPDIVREYSMKRSCRSR